jgi:hypothetical protein
MPKMPAHAAAALRGRAPVHPHVEGDDQDGGPEAEEQGGQALPCWIGTALISTSWSIRKVSRLRSKKAGSSVVKVVPVRKGRAFRRDGALLRRFRLAGGRLPAWRGPGHRRLEASFDGGRAAVDGADVVLARFLAEHRVRDRDRRVAGETGSC